MIKRIIEMTMVAVIGIIFICGMFGLLALGLREFVKDIR
jgi:hypothetical protein